MKFQLIFTYLAETCSLVLLAHMFYIYIFLYIFVIYIFIYIYIYIYNFTVFKGKYLFCSLFLIKNLEKRLRHKCVPADFVKLETYDKNLLVYDLAQRGKCYIDDLKPIQIGLPKILFGLQRPFRLMSFVFWVRNVSWSSV